MKALEQNLLSADIGLLKRCKAAIKEILPDAEIILYGSRARGQAAPDSDYDLLVLTDEEADLDLEEKIRSAIFDLQLEYDVLLSVFAYNRDQWSSPLYRAMPFHKNIDREGIAV
jgi:predicted nucleotidyltransferase